MIQTDSQIIKDYPGIITPFVDHKVSSKGKPSYGLSSMGYDIRLAAGGFELLDNVEDRHVVVPPNAEGSFILPPHSCALGVSYESFDIPNDVLGVALMKSTYARQHVVAHITPLEPGWKGYLTLEIANLSPHYRKVWAMAGIVQIIFLRSSEPCSTDYAKAGGKYQNQPMKVIHAR